MNRRLRILAPITVQKINKSVENYKCKVVHKVAFSKPKYA